MSYTPQCNGIKLSLVRRGDLHCIPTMFLKSIIGPLLLITVSSILYLSLRSTSLQVWSPHEITERFHALCLLYSTKPHLQPPRCYRLADLNNHSQEIQVPPWLHTRSKAWIKSQSKSNPTTTSTRLCRFNGIRTDIMLIPSSVFTTIYTQGKPYSPISALFHSSLRHTTSQPITRYLHRHTPFKYLATSLLLRLPRMLSPSDMRKIRQLHCHRAAYDLRTHLLFRLAQMRLSTKCMMFLVISSTGVGLPRCRVTGQVRCEIKPMGVCRLGRDTRRNGVGCDFDLGWGRCCC